MRADAERRAAAERQRPQTVYLATCAAALRKERESVRRELCDRGHVVHEVLIGPDAVSDEIDRDVRERLHDAAISVHLLGPTYGIIPDGSELSLPELEYRTAQAAAQTSRLRQLVWIPENQGEVDPKQRQFLDRLLQEDKDTAPRVVPEVVVAGIETFKEAIRDAMARSTVATTAPSIARSVYLLCDRADLNRPQLRAMRSYLLNKGFFVDLPAFQGDPGELREWEESKVAENAATVIYYGTARDVWVQRKRRTVINILQRVNRDRCRARAVYLCLPEDEYKTATYTGLPHGCLPEAADIDPLIVLGDCGPFAPEKLDPLLTYLGAN
jgi:hypothetical protein